MSNPLLRAFFVGRAVAEVVNETVEKAIADALSELGKFDAEQRDLLRQFTEEVLARAERAEAAQGGSVGDPTDASGDDLQTTLDDLRADAAQLRADLKRYRAEQGQ
ncbi:MAG: hypothetical protein Fur0042_14300 [Cyanophyceae cyanobacterium]